jgi:N-acetylglucosaminyldiphosphoundecaprenol N-acetyl-beta-D-mannosaminyltransferase
VTTDKRASGRGVAPTDTTAPPAISGRDAWRKPDKVALFGLSFDNLSRQQAMHRLDSYVQSGAPHMVFTPNVAMLVAWRRNASLQRIYCDTDVLTVDGMALWYASRLLGTPIKESLSGSLLFFDVMSMARAKGYSVFLLGAQDDVLEAARRQLAEAYHPVHIVGAHHGYFSSEQGQEIAELIRAAQPDILLIGMSSPLKEQFAWSFRHHMNVPLVLGVGGMFDIAAGYRRAAPDWVRAACLEWLWRTAQEPRRLWRRYATTNTLFLWLLAREMLRLRTAGRTGIWRRPHAARRPPS